MDFEYVCLLLSRSSLYTFKVVSFVRRKMGKIRNDFLQMFGETSTNNCFYEKNIYILIFL